MKKALITGFTGQDGRFLAKFLLSKGYKVYGMVRRVSHPNLDFVEKMGLQDVKIVQGDLLDSPSLHRLIREIKPDEVYNLAAQSFVKLSFDEPELTAEITGMGVLRLLEAIRTEHPSAKFYQASSSEMFGDVENNKPQDEHTSLRPRSPYAAAKVFGHHIVKVYRESYGIFACSGMLLNHSSEYRGIEFFTRKVTDYVGRLANGLVDEPLVVGNLNSFRDESYAVDMVRGMWMMLQHETPDDYVLASGETHSMREFLELAFEKAGINISWEGNGLNEVGRDSTTNKILVVISEKFYRPAEVNFLLGDYSKALKILGWYPETTFSELVEIMVNHDIEKYSV